MKMKQRAKRNGCAVFVAVVALTLAWQVSFPLREVRRWHAWIGKPIKDCLPPSGYDSSLAPCPGFLDCRTDPPGAKYYFSQLSMHRGFIWDSYAYAVIATKSDGTIVNVEIKRFYAAL